MSRASLAARILVLAVVAVLVLTVPGWAGDYWTRILTGVCMWAGLAIAWNVLGGYAGYISFGHAAFFGIGAYATALLMQPGRQWNFFLTLPVGVAAVPTSAARWLSHARTGAVADPATSIESSQRWSAAGPSASCAKGKGGTSESPTPNNPSR